MFVALDDPDTVATSSSAPNSGSASTSSEGTPAQQQQQRQWQQLPRTQLLCSVRALLKKMGVTVLVGDRVVVGAIDWAAGRAAVDEVLPRWVRGEGSWA